MVSVSARAIRAYGGHDVIAMAITAFSMPGTERGDEGERQDEAREGEEDVGDAHQRGVDEPARVAGDGADERARWAPPARPPAGPRRQRDARAIDDPRQDVAALVVGAEPVRADGGNRRVVRRSPMYGEYGREQVGEEGRQDKTRHDEQAQPSRAGCARTCARPRTPARSAACRRERGRSEISQSAQASSLARLDAHRAAHRAGPRVEQSVEQIRQQVEPDEDRADDDRARRAPRSCRRSAASS